MTLKNIDKIDVKIEMLTFQDSERLEHSYIGTFSRKGEKNYLCYNDGFEPCALISDGKKAKLYRYNTHSVMVLETNAEHTFSYPTPMGNMNMNAKAISLKDLLFENGKFEAEYELCLEASEPVINKISIKIEEIKNASN